MDDLNQAFRFAGFTLEPARGVLRGPDGEIRLRPKSYQVLAYLVSHHGRLVSRQELIDSIWGQAAITDDSLTQCLVEIRRALGDEERQMVRTVPRRGYLFDVPLEAPAPAGVTTAAAASARAEHPAARATGKRLRLPALAVVAVALLAITLAWRNFSQTGATAPAAPNSIAVLPFVDMSGTRDQQYLGDGIAEEVLNLLAQSRDLKVIARTSSFSFRDRPTDIRTIAEQLGVNYMLEGSVRRSGDRVRVIAQLIDAGDGTHLWSEDFERELDQVFAVQSEIAGEVATVLHALLSGATAGPVVHDVKAYEHFLWGRFFFHRRGEGDVERAQQHFKTAVELDPDYPAAWAALAGAYMAEFGDGDPMAQPGFVPAREAAARALALDPHLTEGHLRMGTLLFEAGDDIGARRHMDIAETLEPDNLLLLGLKAGTALRKGNRAAAIEHKERVVQRDPLSPLHRRNLAVMLLAAGRLDDARAHVLALRELSPDGGAGYELLMAQVLLLEGRFAEAADSLASLPEDERHDGPRAVAAHALGREAHYQAAIGRLARHDSPFAARALAEVHAQRGDVGSAWHWLEESRRRVPIGVAAAEHWWLLETFTSPLLEPLHDDPRWAAMFDGGPEWFSARTR